MSSSWIDHVTEVQEACFHASSIANPPFFSVSFNRNVLCQEVPDAILQSQPKLGELRQCYVHAVCLILVEQALRNQIQKSGCCQLRVGCDVLDREEFDDRVIVHYSDGGGKKSISCSWLIGADGKRGVVRKRFLEPTADIRQIPGRLKYEGTWIVSNLKLSIPTPETHPDFPLWDFGLSPTEVYDLFWPKGWHFCTPPGMPTACGRFGPYAERLWRHEVEIDREEQTADSSKTLMDQLTPMITRGKDARGRRFARPVIYPMDCIEVLRCQPVTFVQRVVNKWFHKRTILIGDAAHVFPPFGGRGIACGIGDAHTLAWRLALLVSCTNMTETQRNKTLEVWASEQTKAVDDSVLATRLSGDVCRSTESWPAFIARQSARLLSVLPPARNIMHTPTIIADKKGYVSPENGFHLSRFNGGFKVAQIRMKSMSEADFLSDELYSSSISIMTLLVIAQYSTDAENELKEVLRRSDIDPLMLSEKSIRFLHAEAPAEFTHCGNSTVTDMSATPKSKDLTKVAPLTIAERKVFLSRLGRGVRYAIVRPDFIVFATAASIPELEDCIQVLKQRSFAPRSNLGSSHRL